MKQIAIAALVFIAAAFWAFGLGDPEAGEYEAVNGLENWDHSIDISEYEEGKYNLIIRGTDAAGNIQYQGPYNVFVDPASDLPVLRISNPTPEMRVGGSLNIVGASIDDDGVQRVEIQLDEGETRTAEGAEFWSLRLDLEGMADGRHTIRAWAVDVNGNAGEPQEVAFHLDRRAPLVEVVSHQNSALVSGTVVLEGYLRDANGVSSLAYSRQRDGAYEPLKISYDKSEKRYSFDLKIDTEELVDGPQVFWFRAQDTTGSTAYLAFALFVNNEKPQLEILSPQQDKTVNGRILVVGRARDRIGLKSLSYDLGGGESGEIELVPGNPFWTQEFDLTGRKAGNLQIAFSLENLTGGRSNEKLKVRLDPESDRPRVLFAAPKQDSVQPASFEASGHVLDDDGVQSIEISLDGSNPKTVSTEGAFSVPFSEIPAGRHTLMARAVDIHGTAGEAAELQFTVRGEKPVIALTEVKIADATHSFTPGFLIAAEQKAALSGEIRFAGTSIKAEYSLGGRDFKGLSLRKAAEADRRTFEIPLPKDFAPGRVDVHIRATDGVDAAGEYKGFVFLGSIEEAPAEVMFVDARIDEEGRVALDSGQPLIGFVPGSVGSVTIEPETDLLRVSAEGSLVRIDAVKPGVSEPLKVKAEIGSTTVSSAALRFVTDGEPPAMQVAQPVVGSWLGQSMVLEGTVSDASGVRSLEYTLGEDESFTALELSATEPATSFSTTISLGAVAEGAFLFVLRAVDQAGNTAIERIPLYKDITRPLLTLVAPGTEDELNGLITLVGQVEEEGRIAAVEYSEDGSTYNKIAASGDFHFDINLSRFESFPESFELRAVDAAGNVGTLVPALTVNREADKPVVEIQIPGDGEVIKNDFFISGMVFDDDQVAGISYSLDGGEFQDLPPGNNFTVPLSIESISDNEHVIEVRAQDSGGLAGDVVSSTFLVSTSEPESTLLSPGIDQHVRGVIELSGESEDPNGIDTVFISFDNGHSFQLAEGAEQWRYRLDTRLLADGTHALLIKAVDNTGTEGLFSSTINTDNQAPQIIVDTPSDGEVFTESLHLDGRSTDNIALMSLTARLMLAITASELGGDIREYDLSTEGIINRELDIAELAGGWYNLNLAALDAAGNESYVSRNILIQQSPDVERVDLMFPTPGETLAGTFSVSGRVVSEETTPSVLVLLDGTMLDSAPVNENGFFSLDLGPESVEQGLHTLQVQVPRSQSFALVSEEQTILYRRSGSWVQITSAAGGDFISGRPLLEGRAGYFLDPVDSEDGEELKAHKRELVEHAVKRVEVSFDNGKTFQRADGKESWRFRVETQQLENGSLGVLVKASFADGASAVTRTQLQVDTEEPKIVLLSPREGERFNEEIQLRGTADDDETGLQSVEISLREGDKSRYGVPKFIQGLYLDIHAMGATYADVGLGLTFFDDNVKLQFQTGISPPGRFSGLVIGAKLLANIASVPFGYFFGPSWDFFSMSFALGADFSYFTMSGDSIAFTGDGLVLAAVLAQLEFARFELRDWRFFGSYSLYSEIQLWFISSDVEAGLAPRLSFGFRMGLL